MRSILIAVLLLLAWVPWAQGASDIEFNVDFFCGWDGYYRPMEWTPVEIRIGSDQKIPFAGSVVVSARQDGLNTLNVNHSFVLTPGISATFPLVTKFAFNTNRCDITLRDQRGRVRYGQTVNLWDRSAANRLLRAAKDEDLLIGLIGQSQFGILRLHQETQSVLRGASGKVLVGVKTPRMVPWDWTGFVSLDVLVLCDPDWTLLRAEQLEAIHDWVLNGGTVLLILGRHPLPQSSPLRELLPFHIGDLRQTSIPLRVLEEWGLEASQAEPVTAWSLRPKSNALLMDVAEVAEAEPLYGLGPAGFGRAAVLAFDPAQLSSRHRESSARFWRTHIGTCLESGSSPADATDRPAYPGTERVTHQGRSIVLASGEISNRYEQRYRITAAQSAGNGVLEHLYQIRQMRPLSIWWVILTLSALAILLGPVDYLVLKRLDKLPCTWLTSAGWIVFFTVGAYYGVQWIRGGEMEVRAVSVLDGIAGRDCSWATTYMGIFAPRSEQYRLGGLRPNQWWSGIAPSQEEIWIHHRESGLRHIHCRQSDGGNLPVKLPINIWTVQSLAGEWTLDALPFTAMVDPGPEQAIVEIRNISDNAIRSGYVLLAKTYAELGPVKAQSTERFAVELKPRPIEPLNSLPARPHRGRRSRDGWSGVALPQYPVLLEGLADSAFFAEGCLPRTLAMRAYLQSGAALVCVVFEEAPLPFEIEDRSYTVNHVQFARQLVPAGGLTSVDP